MANDRTIFVIKGEKPVLRHEKNIKLHSKDAPVYEDDGSGQLADPSYSDHGTPAPDRNPSFVLRVTTDHRPKNGIGFVIGTDEDECDIVLNDYRVSKKHLAVLLNLTFRTTVLHSLSKHGTQVYFSVQNESRLLKSTNVLLASETATVEISRDFRIQIQRYDDPVDWDQYCASLSQGTTSINIGPLGLDTKIETTGASKRLPFYIRRRLLGQGAFAQVFKAIEQHTGNVYAVKLYNKSGDVRWKEQSTLSHLRHNHVVRYVAFVHMADEPAQLIMEYVEGPNLQDFLRLSSGYVPLGLSQNQDVVRQLLDAVTYLHSASVTHRDIKPANIVLVSSEPVHIKLVDFGLATDADAFNTFCGSPLYAAPELVRGHRPFTNRVDVFSIGVVVLTLFGVSFNVRRGPGGRLGPQAALDAVLEQRKLLVSEYESLPAHLDLGVRLLAERPDDRPSAQQCLSHEFVTMDARAHAHDSQAWGVGHAEEVATEIATELNTELNTASVEARVLRLRSPRHQSKQSGRRDPSGPRSAQPSASSAQNKRQKEVHRSGSRSQQASASRPVVGQHESQHEGQLDDFPEDQHEDQHEDYQDDHQENQEGQDNQEYQEDQEDQENRQEDYGGDNNWLDAAVYALPEDGSHAALSPSDVLFGALGAAGVDNQPPLSRFVMMREHRVSLHEADDLVNFDDMCTAGVARTAAREKCLHLLRGHGVVSECEDQAWIPLRDACFLCSKLDLSPEPLLHLLSCTGAQPPMENNNYLLLPTVLRPEYNVFWWNNVHIPYVPAERIVNMTAIASAMDVKKTRLRRHLADWRSIAIRHKGVAGTYAPVDAAAELCAAMGLDPWPVQCIAADCTPLDETELTATHLNAADNQVLDA